MNIYNVGKNDKLVAEKDNRECMERAIFKIKTTEMEAEMKKHVVADMLKS